MGKFVDLTGQKFNRLTVIERDLEKSNKKRVMWKCKCDCGNITSARTCDLKSEHYKSCGCYGREAAREGTIRSNKERTKHGMYGTKFYRVWDSMIGRCTRSSSRNYDSYGGRGIKVSESWRDFENFYNDMYKSYKLHYEEHNGDTSIERIDVNGDYCKENCCWKTMKEQHRNRRDSFFIEYEGEKLTIMDLAERYNLPYSTVYSRHSRGHELIKEDER